MTHRTSLAFFFVLLSIVAGIPADEVSVPPELAEWQAWVLDGKEHLGCPFYAAGDHGQAERHPCAWPGRLELETTATGGSFSISWRAYGETWIPLPGGSGHWPIDIELDGEAVPVVTRDGRPALFVSKGVHSIRGQFSWQRRPESLPIPTSIGRIQLIIDGESVFPLQRSGGSLWLGRAATDSGEADTLAVEVYRLLSDGIPSHLETRLRLDVSGQGREEVLGPVLPAGFEPISVSSELQAVLDNDGRVRLQLRPGQWSVAILARATSGLSQVQIPPAAAPWPEQEIWSYGAEPRLRVTAATGGLAVDPSQVNVPPDWGQLPAFSLNAGQQLTIDERSRGMADDSNRLHLRRQLWIDFDDRGMTARDRVEGRMVRGFRLDVAEPLTLSRAQANGSPLLVTAGAEPGLTGVELRSPEVALEATSRLEPKGGALPVSGWSESFESVRITLHLPPGRQLIAALGADSSPQSWVDRWSLLDLFLLLITALLIDRFLGRRWAAAAVAFLALSYHESPGPLWVLLLLVSLLLIRGALPAGRLARLVQVGSYFALLLLTLVVLPFVAEQLRLALYPQLERYSVGPSSDFSAYSKMPEAVLNQVQEEAAPEPMLESSRVRPQAPEKKSLRRFDRYAASNVFQSGGAEPAWAWRQASLSWSGPVLPEQQVRLILTPVWLTRLLRVLMVALLAALIARLLKTMTYRPRESGDKPTGEPESGSHPEIVVLSLLALVAAVTVQGQETPEPDLLKELGDRLTRAPECVPECGRLESAAVLATESRLEIDLTVHAAAFVAVPIPDTADRSWNLETIEVDGRRRDQTLASGAYRWLALEKGVHRIRLSGPLAATNSAELAFPMLPARISVRAAGWDIGGVREQRLVTDTLSLIRIRDRSASPSSEVAAIKVPPFVRVERTFDLDLDWTVTTTVTRLAPTTGSLVVEVPLLKDENVLTAGFEVSDGAVTAALPAGSNATRWQSRLERLERLEITAPELTARAEVWKVLVSPQWSAEFSGPPPILSDQNDGFWVHEFHPLPAESLVITVGQPAPVAGATLAIDQATLSSEVGRRATEHTLTLSLRSTRGGQHTLALPSPAEVLGVSLDGTALNIRPDEGRLTVPVNPGEQVLEIRFRDRNGSAFLLRSPVLDLGASASNLEINMNMPANRWVLMTGGPRVGPAVLFWGELLVMVLLAALLARLGNPPLKLRHWVLLGLGFSTFSWPALVVVVVWIFSLDARRRLDAKTPWLRFDLLQLVLVGLTVAALGCLIVAIPHGLLGTPDMHIEGNGSSAYSLNWFDDLSDGPMPEVAALSLPIWVYRAAMLVWALWLATAVITWLRWGWQCLTTSGGWRSRPRPEVS